MRLIVGLALVLASGSASTSEGLPAVAGLPTVMVIPFTTEAEDLRTVLESDINRRIAVTTIKEAFGNKGYTTIDFVAKLKAVKENLAFTMESQRDFKSQLLQFSGCDLFVQAEVAVARNQSGNSATVVLTAFETSTARSLASATGFSGQFYTDDFGRLVQRAVDKISDDFLASVTKQFRAMTGQGRSIFLNVSVAQGAGTDLTSEVGIQKTRLSDLIEEWVDKTAQAGSYHIQGVTAKSMVFDEIRIPWRDPASGQSFTPTRFALEFTKSLRSSGVLVDRDIKGNTIFITIK